MNANYRDSRPVWRLIPLMRADGATQMAIDRWLFEQYVQGLHPPTLRFYIWEPIALSLGYHQRQIPDHWRSLTYQDQPIDLVRRPSGGRAVLHQGDLTYAVVTSELGPSRKAAYEKICAFLIEGWRSLGISLQYGNAGRGYIHNPNCFGTATSADLVTDSGYKLVGSAQLRRGECILQHGSMRLCPDCDLFYQVFGEAQVADEQVKSAIGDPPDLAAIIAVLVTAAEQCFGIRLAAQPITHAEWRQVAALINTRQNFRQSL
ncbi:biotin/lipoate A/B protein ligase family protein [Thermoleptolyngbya sp. C42_A2020_037]|uniref:lipoate--protein ligase family protein n=1 Tax=Thermoleptolyngbya sp. C42_A2020_037 TaxID=2747799 RepID=UPI0019DF2873|nr:biotin/lipoate A/B protein ligase family protein [Thermoleptolyngbya sp. C42_A2020_037]MBF2084245.1 lipoate--protein ligase family protein [Thermoleptolyngbya sp. C42_A2020_037]